MGPTIFLPGTHTDEVHARFRDQAKHKDDLLKSVPSKCGLLPKGSASVFDSRFEELGFGLGGWGWGWGWGMGVGVWGLGVGFPTMEEWV